MKSTSNVTILEDEILLDQNDDSSHRGYMVMMRWEDEIMKLHAKWVTHNQGDILEFGFGMGLSATHIQSYKPKSHTIIEIHPEMAKKAKAWAKGRPGVKIIHADWWDVKDELGKYDGIFFDTFNDPHEPDFPHVLKNLVKPNCHVSFYNNRPFKGNGYDLPVQDYIPYKVYPTKNDYFMFSWYYVPLLILNP